MLHIPALPVHAILCLAKPASPSVLGVPTTEKLARLQVLLQKPVLGHTQQRLPALPPQAVPVLPAGRQRMT